MKVAERDEIPYNGVEMPALFCNAEQGESVDKANCCLGSDSLKDLLFMLNIRRICQDFANQCRSSRLPGYSIETMFLPRCRKADQTTFFLRFLVLFILSVWWPVVLQAQESPSPNSDTTCVQKDMADVIRGMLGKPAKTEVSIGSLLLIPIIGSNPATGFAFGLGGQYAFKFGGAETRYSILSGSAQLTTKNQKIFLLKNNVYTKNNNLFFTGDWRYLFFSQSTYGLGTDAPQGGILDYQYHLDGLETSIDSLAQPLKFTFVRFYQSASFRIKKMFYVGGGYFLDYYYDIEDERLLLSPEDSLITSHYAYNRYYGFSEKKYYSSALNVNVIVDSRDNMINPYKGQFLLISFSGALEILGNKNNASFLSLEWRSFHPLSPRNPRHLLAFWVLGNLTPEGEFPYLILPATAYDQRGRSARGYTQGRFRGNDFLYAETEYRFPIFCR